ncbi:glycosyltransferase family 2 protein [Flavobacterium antarcticum]|uniref:glycosyltransferase family 2 protein n=1 Tax=Flavobacterium antarcticum TaxID=271155 RepID=UPI0003B6A0D7|nr:glycosyltransferase family A protein [Flavobacterium antarcticum]
MILLMHNFKEVTSIILDDTSIPFNSRLSIAKNVYTLALQFPNKIIIWSHEDVGSIIDLDYCSSIFESGRSMRSYNPIKNYLTDTIGYVEDSPFINVSKKVIYPTWQMSSLVGGIKATVILQTDERSWDATDFDYCLNSIAKIYQPLGLFCYSDPKLLKATTKLVLPKANFNQLFKFVKQHYKVIWVYLLLLNILLHDKKVPFFSVLNTFFVKKHSVNNVACDFKSEKIKSDVSKETIDVIIPTIGRKQYLHDVLLDLKAQLHLPVRVIIVEQNPLLDSVSELDYIENENWPFEIKHIFTHRAGACNARNLALEEVKSKWFFLNDDDNRFESTLIRDALQYLLHYKFKCITTFYPQKKEKMKSSLLNQSAIFGSGNAFLDARCLNDVQFSNALEFGYGEDSDFGMQLRNVGIDVIYVPKLVIVHLKAPIGGFRTKPVLKWSKEIIQPKPSPTIMLYKMKHNTTQQILGYKSVLFFKYYKAQKIKNPFRYYEMFQKQWKQSVFWATELNKVK